MKNKKKKISRIVTYIALSVASIIIVGLVTATIGSAWWSANTSYRFPITVSRPGIVPGSDRIDGLEDTTGDEEETEDISGDTTETEEETTELAEETGEATPELTTETPTEEVTPESTETPIEETIAEPTTEDEDAIVEDATTEEPTTPEAQVEETIPETEQDLEE